MRIIVGAHVRFDALLGSSACCVCADHQVVCGADRLNLQQWESTLQESITEPC
jgi:hypothetical protein